MPELPFDTEPPSFDTGETPSDPDSAAPSADLRGSRTSARSRSPTVESLNPEQRRAVTHSGGPCLVLAGAGSGKTRVLTHRIVWLISEAGVPPASICAVTFTNKAAAEMRARVRELLGHQPQGLTLSTFHSLGLRLLREWAGRPGAPAPGFAVYDRDASLSMWRRCQRSLRISSRDYDPGRLLSSCSRAVNRLEDPGTWDEPGRPWDRRIAARVWREYRRGMAAANALDFDDLLHRPLSLITGDHELRRQCQERFAHLLVDEYQDTNRIQYRLVRGLLGDARNLMVVGDEDQSIYRWRGADLANVLEFQQDFPGATIIRLEQNYRSTQPILSAASSLVAHNRQRLGKELWTEDVGGDKPEFAMCPTDRHEAEFVVDQIEHLCGATGPSSPGSEALPWSETAVLFRTNAQSRLFEEALLARRIPHRIVGGQRFFSRREVRDLLSYLTLLVRHDDVALRRAATTPRRRIGAVTLDALARIDSARGPAATLARLAGAGDPERALRDAGVPATGAAGLLELAGLLGQLRQLAARATLGELIHETIDRSGYAALLGDEPDGDDRLANLDQLVAAADEMTVDLAARGAGDATGGEDAADGAAAAPSQDGAAATGTETLSRLRLFLDRVALLTDSEQESGNADGVRLLTVHAAKGLEFDTVFLVGLEEELFPHASALADGQLEEERRLAYVGMTRARRRLFLTAARSRRIHGRERWQEPARFLKEIDPRHLMVREEFPRLNTATLGGSGSRRSFTSRGSRARGRSPTDDRSRYDGAGVPTPAPREPEPRVADFTSEPTRVATAGELVPGTRVLHPKFGTGKILDATGSGDKLKLTIGFRKAGRKTVLARYARLEVRVT